MSGTSISGSLEQEVVYPYLRIGVDRTGAEAGVEPRRHDRLDFCQGLNVPETEPRFA